VDLQADEPRAGQGRLEDLRALLDVVDGPPPVEPELDPRAYTADAVVVPFAALDEPGLELPVRPREHGYSTELWTLARVAEVIAVMFGVECHRSAVWHILRATSWSCRKPRRRPRRNDTSGIVLIA